MTFSLPRFIAIFKITYVLVYITRQTSKNDKNEQARSPDGNQLPPHIDCNIKRLTKKRF